MLRLEERIRMSKIIEPILIPYCKFQNGYPPKWSYYDISGQRNFSSPGFIFGYCSIYREDYAIYGQYHYHSQDKNLVFGVINRKLESVENAIYSNLNFYPGSCNCFIGRLNSKQNIEKEHCVHQIFFNVSNNFWTTGFQITPLTNRLVLINNLEQEVKIITTEGILVNKLPYYINKDGKEVPFSKNCLGFLKAIMYGDLGFSLCYLNVINHSYYADEYEMEMVESYCEEYYFFDFDNEGNLLNQGTKTSFDKSRGLSFIQYDESKWVPTGIIELSFMEVQTELFENKLISSDNIFNPVFYNASVYKSLWGNKFWEPKSEDFINKAKL